jgi:hypothetical protein
MVNFILVMYVLPMLINLVVVLVDKDTKSIGHVLDASVPIFIPGINFLLCLLIPIVWLEERLGKLYAWEKFRNIKIKK